MYYSPLNPFATPEEVVTVLHDTFHPGVYDQHILATYGVAWPKSNVITANGIRLPQNPGAIHAIQQHVQAEVGLLLPIITVIIVASIGRVMVVCDPTRIGEMLPVS